MIGMGIQTVDAKNGGVLKPMDIRKHNILSLCQFPVSVYQTAKFSSMITHPSVCQRKAANFVTFPEFVRNRSRFIGHNLWYLPIDREKETNRYNILCLLCKHHTKSCVFCP